MHIRPSGFFGRETDETFISHHKPKNIFGASNQQLTSAASLRLLRLDAARPLTWNRL
jgi:hypothetical protein